MEKVYKLYQHIKRDCESPRLRCQAAGSPRWELGSFQKCSKQLKRRNQWAPSLLSGFRWVLLSWSQVQLNRKEVTSIPMATSLPGPGPNSWLDVSPHPPAPLPKGSSPRGKTEGMGSSGQKSQTQDSQEASVCRGLSEELRGRGCIRGELILTISLI